MGVIGEVEHELSLSVRGIHATVRLDYLRERQRLGGRHNRARNQHVDQFIQLRVGALGPNELNSVGAGRFRYERDGLAASRPKRGGKVTSLARSGKINGCNDRFVTRDLRDSVSETITVCHRRCAQFAQVRVILLGCCPDDVETSGVGELREDRARPRQPHRAPR